MRNRAPTPVWARRPLQHAVPGDRPADARAVIARHRVIDDDATDAINYEGAPQGSDRACIGEFLIERHTVGAVIGLRTGSD